MRNWDTFTIKRPSLLRRAVDAIVKYAVGERMKELESRQDQLHVFIESTVGFEKRWKEDQRLCAERHSDWISECERQQNRHDEFIKLVAVQNAIMERMARQGER